METAQRAERAESNGQADDARSLRARIASLGLMNVLIGCTIAQIVAAGARELLLIATTAEFRDSWRVVAPVTAGVVSWTWYGTLSQSILFRSESVRRLPLITIVAAGANLGVNFLLIPRIGIEGAAWATFVSNSTLAAGALYVGSKSVSIPYDFRRWAVTSAWAGVALVVIWQLDANLDAFVPRILAKAVWLAVSVGITMRLAGVRMRAVLDVILRR
jgi:O-antigen/teichoic acid export membrane protein